MENEAVIHRLIKDSEGELELIDASHLVEGLKFTPGLSKWVFQNKKFTLLLLHKKSTNRKCIR